MISQPLVLLIKTISPIKPSGMTEKSAWRCLDYPLEMRKNQNFTGKLSTIYAKSSCNNILNLIGEGLPMPSVSYKDKQFEINIEGYLKTFDSWTAEFSRAIAKQEGIEDLTDEHWLIIEYVRNYYAKRGIAPMILKLQRDLKISIWRIHELFPTTSERAICKIAGLPKPTGCI
ncbi:MAG: TusE/DsrC/DsvC family sulfur relay protein [Deltaproteobacteria bacterium]|nr:MAG: TusE/DsrC/DsvC family sulfur relay protein [Deltaproteobacteria bacterium]